MAIADEYLAHRESRMSFDEKTEDNWLRLGTSLPSIFIRDNDYDEIQTTDDSRQKLILTIEAQGRILSGKDLNREERDYCDSGTVGGFINYLKELPASYRNPRDHVLGFLSADGRLYTDFSFRLKEPIGRTTQ